MKKHGIRLLVALILLMLAGTMNQIRFSRTYGTALIDARVEAAPAIPTVNLLLGGFRGVVADWLWLRAMILQEQGRFVEIVQLAEWITALQPQFTDIWALHAWNLAYNITVLLPDGQERWRWVRHGYEILRDQAIPATRYHARICAELAWLLMHKIAGTSDDFADTLFVQWLQEFESLLDTDGRIPADTARQAILYKKIGIPAARIESFEQTYGTHDWRHPLTHAAAWAFVGFTLHPGSDGTAMAERLFLTIYRQLFLQGTLATDPDSGDLLLLPDFDRHDGVLQAFADATERTPGPRLAEAHLLTLETLIQVLAAYGQYEEARTTYSELLTRFPDAPAAKQGFRALITNPSVHPPRRITTPGRTP